MSLSEWFNPAGPWKDIPSTSVSHDVDSREEDDPSAQPAKTNRYVRLAGREVDNPVRGTKAEVGGYEARDFAQSLLRGGQERTAAGSIKGSNRRLVEARTADGKDVATEIVREGWASPGPTSDNRGYSAQTEAARDFHSGDPQKSGTRFFADPENQELIKQGIQNSTRDKPMFQKRGLGNEIAGSVVSGVHNLGRSGAGLIQAAGEVTGSEDTFQYGKQLAQGIREHQRPYAREINTWEKAIDSPSNFAKYTGGAVGESGVNFAPLVAGGLAGARIGGMVGGVPGALIGGAVGGLGGAIANQFGLLEENKTSHLSDDGLRMVESRGNLGSQLGTSAVLGALDRVGLDAIIKPFAMTGVKGVLKRIGGAAPVESGVEGLQTVGEEAFGHLSDPTHAFAPNGLWAMVKEPMIQGGLAAAAMSAPPAIIQALKSEDQRIIDSPERSARGPAESSVVHAASKFLGFELNVAGDQRFSESGRTTTKAGTSLVYGPHDEADEKANAKAIVSTHMDELNTALWADHPHVARNLDRQVSTLMRGEGDVKTPSSPEEQVSFKQALFTKALVDTKKGGNFQNTLQRLLMDQKLGGELSIPWADVDTESGKSLAPQQANKKTQPLIQSLKTLAQAAVDSKLVGVEDIPQYIDTLGTVLDFDESQSKEARDSKNEALSKLFGSLDPSLIGSVIESHAIARGLGVEQANMYDPQASLVDDRLAEGEASEYDDSNPYTEEQLDAWHGEAPEGVNLHADNKLKHVILGAPSALEASVPQYKKDEQGQFVYDELGDKIQESTITRLLTGQGSRSHEADDLGRVTTPEAPSIDENGAEYYEQGDGVHGVRFEPYSNKPKNIHDGEFDKTSFYYKTIDGEMNAGVKSRVDKLNFLHAEEQRKQASDEGAEDYYKDLPFDKHGMINEVYKPVEVRNAAGNVLGHVIVRLGFEHETDTHNMEAKIQRMSYVSASTGHAGRGPGSAAADEHGGLVASEYVRDNYIPFYDKSTGNNLPRYIDPFIAIRLGKELSGDSLDHLGGTAKDLAAALAFISHLASNPRYVVNPKMDGLYQEDAALYDHNNNPEAQARGGMTRKRTLEDGRKVMEHMEPLGEADISSTGKAEYVMDSFKPDQVLVPGKHPITVGDLTMNNAALQLNVERVEASNPSEKTIVESKIRAWQDKYKKDLPRVDRANLNAILEARGLSKIGFGEQEDASDVAPSAWLQKPGAEDLLTTKQQRAYDTSLSTAARARSKYDNAHDNVGNNIEDSNFGTTPEEQGISPYKVKGAGSVGSTGGPQSRTDEVLAEHGIEDLHIPGQKVVPTSVVPGKNEVSAPSAEHLETEHLAAHSKAPKNTEQHRVDTVSNAPAVKANERRAKVLAFSPKRGEAKVKVTAAKKEYEAAKGALAKTEAIITKAPERLSSGIQSATRTNSIAKLDAKAQERLDKAYEKLEHLYDQYAPKPKVSKPKSIKPEPATTEPATTDEVEKELEQSPEFKEPIKYDSSPEQVNADLVGAKVIREGYWKDRIGNKPELAEAYQKAVNDLMANKYEGLKSLYESIIGKTHRITQFLEDFKAARGEEYKGGIDSGMKWNGKVYMNHELLDKNSPKYDPTMYVTTLIHEAGHLLDNDGQLTEAWTRTPEFAIEYDRVMEVVHGTNPVPGSEPWHTPAELLAEFNVIRHLLPEVAKSVAPKLDGILNAEYQARKSMDLGGMQFPEGVEKIRWSKTAGVKGFDITFLNSDATGIRVAYDEVVPIVDGKRSGDAKSNSEVLFGMYRNYLAANPALVSMLWNGAKDNNWRFVDTRFGDSQARGHSQIAASILTQMSQGVPVAQTNYSGMYEEDASEDAKAYEDMQAEDREAHERAQEISASKKAIREAYASAAKLEAGSQEKRDAYDNIKLMVAEHNAKYSEDKYETYKQRQAREEAANKTEESANKTEESVSGAPKEATAKSIADVIKGLNTKYPMFTFSQEQDTGGHGDRATMVDGRVVLFTDNLHTINDVYDAIDHEVIGHGAMRFALGDKHLATIRQIYNSADSFIQALKNDVINRYSDVSDKDVLADELVARIAEKAHQGRRANPKDQPTLAEAMEAVKANPNEANVTDLINAAHLTVLSAYHNGDFQAAGFAERFIQDSSKLGGKIIDRVKLSQFGRQTLDAIEAGTDFGTNFLGPIFQSLDPRLRAMGEKAGSFMDLFWHPVGTQGHEFKDTIPNVEAKDRVEFTHGTNGKDGLVGVIEKLPKINPWYKSLASKSARQESKDAERIMAEGYAAHLRKDTGSNVSAEALAVKDILDEYMPRLNKMLADKYPTLNKAGFSEKVPMYVDQAKWSKGKDKIIQILQDTGMTKAAATTLWKNKSVATSLVELQDDNPLTSSFGSWNDIPEAARDKLIEFVNTNVAQLLLNYIHAGTKRGVLDQFIGGWVIGVDGKKRFNATLRAQELADSLSGSDRSDFVHKIMPALLGTLGSRMTPELRSINSWGTVFLNTTLLPLATTSQFVDLGGIAVRDEHLTRVFGITAKLLTNKTFRKQMVKEANEALPSMHRDIAEMMSGAGLLSTKAGAINSAFFRLNLMQSWSEASRILAYTVGKQALRRYADQATNGKTAEIRQRGLDDLAELHLTPKDIHKWDGSVTPNMAVALNQWVDGAVLKPGAPIRPVWQSDSSKVLLSYLHAYTSYAYETFGKRIVHNMERRTGAARLGPAAVAVGTMLPLVIAGSSLRAAISNAGSGDDEKKKRNLFADFMRTGVAGPAAQTAFDMYQAQGHGGSMLASTTVLTSVIEQMLKTIKLDANGLPELDEQQLIANETPVLRASKLFRDTIGSEHIRGS